MCPTAGMESYYTRTSRLVQFIESRVDSSLTAANCLRALKYRITTTPRVRHIGCDRTSSGLVGISIAGNRFRLVGIGWGISGLNPAALEVHIVTSFPAQKYKQFSSLYQHAGTRKTKLRRDVAVPGTLKALHKREL